MTEKPYAYEITDPFGEPALIYPHAVQPKDLEKPHKALFTNIQHGIAPTADAGALTVEAAEQMGAEGAPHSEPERALFEAYMRGHCWGVGEWNAEKGHYGDIWSRTHFAVWRDRAALSAPSPKAASAQKGLSDEQIIERAEVDGIATLETGWYRMTRGGLIDFARALLRESEGS
jgi:hypothetical protein